MQFSKSLLAIACLVGTVSISIPVTANSPVNTSFQIAQSSSQMDTQMTPRGKNKIDAVIHEIDSEFHFEGTLTRTSGNTFTGSDKQVTVTYNQNTGNIVIKNKVTGTEFYNYTYSSNSNSNSNSNGNSNSNSNSHSNSNNSNSNSNSNPTTTTTTTQSNVSSLQDLVGAHGSGGETQLEKRGYTFVRASQEGNSSYTYWKNAKTGECIVVRTEDGRYASITASPNECVDSTVDEGAL